METEVEATQETIPLSEKVPSNERQTILKYVRQWGGSASDAVLDPVCKIFEHPGIEGLVGYRCELSAAVVFGDPICARENVPELVQAFHQYCQTQGKSVIYVTASHWFKEWAMQKACRTSIEFGEGISFDPHDNPRQKTGVNASLVRRKVRHAEKEGVLVQEYHPLDLQLESEIEQVAVAWLKGRTGPQIYISHVRLFEDRLGKRWFYAKQNEKIVGILLLSQLHAHQGWLLNRLMVTPDAPNGTPESLVVAALDALAAEGCHYVTVGVVPGDELGEISGLGRLATALTRKGYKIASHFFRLNSRRKFWEKFHPQSEPSYLLFSQAHIKVRDVLGLLKALNISLK
jgi:lysylphosphatidylglycerol synthetase-like protein (DUF2156 family)